MHGIQIKRRRTLQFRWFFFFSLEATQELPDVEEGMIIVLRKNCL
jgi:hypothetical protein